MISLRGTEFFESLSDTFNKSDEKDSKELYSKIFCVTIFHLKVDNGFIAEICKYMGVTI